MGNEIEIAYKRGIRAVYKAAEPEFVNSSGETTTWSTLDDWLALRKYQLKKIELSRTWKERHAKGVPVKMKWSDIDQFINKLPVVDRHALYGMSGSYLKSGYPHATQMADGLKATFCNFRYKPEWLAKQSRKNCHGFASEQPKAQCTGSL